eukprot:TRINITY_DN1211_c0_g1_i1.p1 TRINITY_DN1211_c0_g1~~TRINITY_DN1211_c0_g1_i1.p1  ORF type:complete len:433 (+),score=93.43 TRINITY_DN1211_c0_g1_i1:55-1353(+)
MIRRPPRSTLSSSSAASDVYKRQYQRRVRGSPLSSNGVLPVAMRIRAFLTLLVLAQAWVGLEALPVPQSHGEVLVPRQDVRHLEQIESDAWKNAGELVQSIKGAVTRRSRDTSQRDDLGQARRLSDDVREQYERHLHGDVRPGHQKADDEGRKELLREQIHATESSTRHLEAAATWRARREAKVGRSARDIALSAEKRREHHELEEATAWMQRERSSLDQIASRASEGEAEQRNALAVDKHMMEGPPADPAATVRLPDGVAQQSKERSARMTTDFQKIASTAASLKDFMDQRQRLGEPVPAGSVKALEQRLSDAEATKKMVAGDADQRYHEQQAHNSRTLEQDVDTLRKKFQPEANDLALQRAKVEGGLKDMERVAEQVKISASHEFSEFENILEESHHTRAKADNKLTHLEAMMVALKTQRSMRLMRDDVL